MNAQLKGLADMTRRGTSQAIKHDMDKANEADKSPDVHGDEQDEPASTTRTRKKASEAVDKVCCTRYCLC